VLADWAAVRALVDEFLPPGAPRAPLASGEWGWTTATKLCGYACVATEAEQAQWVVRSWLVNAAANVRLNIAYDWRDDGNDTNVCEQNFGAVHVAPTGDAAAPFAPKPLYTAAAAAQATVGNAAAAAGRVVAAAAAGGNAADVFVVAFVGGGTGAGAFAVWSNATAPTTATFAVASPATPGLAPDACFALVDWLGAQAEPARACAAGGAITLNATAGPLYAMPVAR